MVYIGVVSGLQGEMELTMPPKGQIAREIESAILTNAFKLGDMLPPERMLAHRYRVTRNTIRRALSKLSDAGLIQNQPRIGYKVVSSIRNGRVVNVRLVGLLWHSAVHAPNESRFQAALENGLANSGHALMIADTRHDALREDETIRRLCAAGMDALIIAPARHGARSVELEKWIVNRKPVVLHGHPGRWLLPDKLVVQCDMIDTDNRQAVSELLNVFSILGHRTVGYVGQEPLGMSERFQMFVELVSEYGLHTESAWHVDSPVYGNFDARAAVGRLRLSGKMPTAIMCSHDSVAYALVAAFKEVGVRCPENVSITGFGNLSADNERTDIELTTVEDNYKDHSAEIIRLLSKQFSGDFDHPERVRLPVRLILRRSVSPKVLSATHR